jgi:hypothetical protein
MCDEKTKRIAALNDELRSRVGMPPFFSPPGRGLAVMTRGIISLSPENQIIPTACVRDFNSFSEDNDPHGEHDFGAFEIEGVSEKIFWKIDYYADADCKFGSEDPSDPAQCYRVITIMLAWEY